MRGEEHLCSQETEPPNLTPMKAPEHKKGAVLALLSS